VNDVIIIIIEGASERIVNSASTCKVTVKSAGLSVSSAEIVMLGYTVCENAGIIAMLDNIVKASSDMTILRFKK
jgi:hypothetical protein